MPPLIRSHVRTYPPAAAHLASTAEAAGAFLPFPRLTGAATSAPGPRDTPSRPRQQRRYIPARDRGEVPVEPAELCARAEPRPAGTTTMPLQNGARAAAEAEAQRQGKPPAGAGPRRPGAAVVVLLLLRVAALCASAAAAALAATGGAALLGRAPFRFLLAADAIVAAYSALEAAAAAREAAGGATLLPEPVQLWFDFGHDQGFGYMALAAAAQPSAY
ncbi:CASP-like protein 4C1 [Panicum miliaceum]|uniref:CASP-like protein n=1 Tax=Panicum miliaceum TaxID=4540 RepID=A0A3L6SXM2_PANMI|nr:CASP-like protein 4C1 [Panicum miliaceum]